VIAMATVVESHRRAMLAMMPYLVRRR
jgi:hypothetical protein